VGDKGKLGDRKESADVTSKFAAFSLTEKAQKEAINDLEKMQA